MNCQLNVDKNLCTMEENLWMIGSGTRVVSGGMVRNESTTANCLCVKGERFMAGSFPVVEAQRCNAAFVMLNEVHVSKRERVQYEHGHCRKERQQSFSFY